MRLQRVGAVRPGIGMSFLRSTFLLVIVMSAGLAGCAGYVPGRQPYWDAKVEEMCAKDGGVVIFEKLRISKADIELFSVVGGKIGVPVKRLAKPNSPAYSELEITKIQEGNPSVTRTESTIIRRTDGAVIAKWIVYSRFGGDFPSPIHPSSYRCPELGKIASDLQALFIVEENQK